MCGISSIKGVSSNCGKQQMTVNIDGQNIKLTGNPDNDAQTVANTLGCSVEEAKSKLKEQLGEPQQPQQQSGIGSTQIGSMLSGETSWK